VRRRVSPDLISAASIAVAALGCAVLLGLPASPWTYLACALCVQLRLLCNLLDGMVAIEGGLKSPLGGLWNEVPDRVADSLFIVALGYAAGVPSLGWLGALAAAVTAYIRVLGGTLLGVQDFRGPMAKPHRMALMTGTLVVAAVELGWRGTHWTLMAGSALIAVGSILTCGTRLAAQARLLRA